MFSFLLSGHVKPDHDNTWELAADLFKRFPDHKLILNGGSIDKIYHTYYCKKKRSGEEKEADVEA